MRQMMIAALCLFLCSCACNCNKRPKEHIYVAGYEIEKGQQMRDFFDDFEEPMHARYIGGDVVNWTYYIDKNDNNRIVRYCELKNYAAHSLCTMDVTFYRTYVSGARSSCR